MEERRRRVYTAARKSLSKSFMRKRSRRVRGVHTYTHTYIHYVYVLCRKLLSIHGFLGENEEDPLSLSHCRAHIFSPLILRLPFAHSPIVPLNRELIDEGFRFLFFFFYFFFCFFFYIIFSCCPPRLNTNGNVKIKMISEGRTARKGKKGLKKKESGYTHCLAVKSHHTHTQTI